MAEEEGRRYRFGTQAQSGMKSPLSEAEEVLVIIGMVAQEVAIAEKMVCLTVV